MIKKYLILDLDWTLINSNSNIKDLILLFFKNKEPNYYDKVRYNLDFNKISNIQDLLKIIYWNNYDLLIEKNIYDFLDKNNQKNSFIEWTLEKILELKDKYTLYLSTWSSTKSAENILQKGWVKQYFEMIQWSDMIPKSEEHLDIFKIHSWDKDFFKKAISIWDSIRDELFATNRNIDFIKIWNKYKSIYDINNI